MELPANFTPLLDHFIANHTVTRAVQYIRQTYQNSFCLLNQEDRDPLHIQFHCDQLQECIFPLFIALSDEGIPVEWLTQGTHILGRIFQELEIAANSAQNE
jgi:hypothetical protein